jgi:hypothetical protein
MAILQQIERFLAGVGGLYLEVFALKDSAEYCDDSLVIVDDENPRHGGLPWGKGGAATGQTDAAL